MRSELLFQRARAACLPVLLALAVAACGSDETPDIEAAPAADVMAEGAAVNQLTPEEEAAGWRLLFDGESFENWRGLGRDTVPTGHWEIVDGAIRHVPHDEVAVQADGQPLDGGDLMTQQAYEDFEFTFEWKVSPGGNSGIKYNVSEEMSTSQGPGHAALGFEYQVLDDERHPDADKGAAGNRQAAGLYDLIGPVEDKPINPPGEWNQGRIVFRGNHGEHWLNGVKVLEYELGSERMDSLLAASKYATIPGFADRRTGHIVLQDHNDEVWYRNLKVREL